MEGRHVKNFLRKLIWAAGGLSAAKLLLSISVPLPDGAVLTSYVERAGSPLLKLYNHMNGGAPSKGTAFALGIMPYLSARMFMALARRKSKWGTRGLTVGISVVQGIGYARFTEKVPGVVAQPGLAYTVQTVLMVTVVSTLLMLVAEEATNTDEATNTNQEHPLLPREVARERYVERESVFVAPTTPIP